MTAASGSPTTRSGRSGDSTSRSRNLTGKSTRQARFLTSMWCKMARSPLRGIRAPAAGCIP
jgi:hypothetical protein